MSIQSIIKQYDFNLQYAEALVSDLDEQEMTTVPSKGLVNHPAFTIGHLISGSADLASDLGGTNDMSEEWLELFLRKGPGDPRYPVPDSGKYPPKHKLLAELGRQHEKVKQLIADFKKEDWSNTIIWRFNSYMPSYLDLVTFMCINHEAMHLGQLAAWRRAMDKPSALATL